MGRKTNCRLVVVKALNCFGPIVLCFRILALAYHLEIDHLLADFSISLGLRLIFLTEILLVFYIDFSIRQTHQLLAHLGWISGSCRNLPRLAQAHDRRHFCVRTLLQKAVNNALFRRALPQGLGFGASVTRVRRHHEIKLQLWRLQVLGFEAESKVALRGSVPAVETGLCSYGRDNLLRIRIDGG